MGDFHILGCHAMGCFFLGMGVSRVSQGTAFSGNCPASVVSTTLCWRTNGRQVTLGWVKNLLLYDGRSMIYVYIYIYYIDI